MAYYKDAASWKATWPMNDTVTTTKADVLEQVHLSFEDALQSEREEYWYEGHCASLTYLTGLYRHSGGSFTVAPQAPLFARTRKERLTVQGRNASGALGDDADGEYDGAAMAIDEEDADLNYVAAGKTLRRTRSISHDIGESHEELAFPGPKLYGPSENMDTDAQQHAVMAEEDAISSGMGSASDPLNKSTSSKPPDRENQQYSDDDSFHRVTDFAIVRRRQQRVVVCVVEIKPQTWTALTVLDENEERAAALKQVEAMMPQVVQQVQFAFHEQPAQEYMWALCIVGRWCAFQQFERKKTPPLDLDDLHARGYRPAMQAQGKFQPAATRISIGMADVVPVLADDNQDYHPKFKSAWLKFMTWACTMQLRVGE
ncbi:hypothetical protein FA95DRAFT_1683119 [Auriscalpium vulgare]|uniref:Uncharacterized protein n=1 Tax=Auriscalpium vulgare TaxID=40419 RepID=A0ACB8RC35_9AGAM|nr:hypothetical protein FA95DRAFT_1683119 [Auriscalpium vulgare]